MSFLSKNNSEFLSVRITQKGRNSIAKGNFIISYFQIGDSEFDYTSPFDSLTGLNSVPFQSVFSPLDKEGGVKYPYKLDSSSNSTVYGIPVQSSTTDTLRNIMGPAGFVTNFKEYDSEDCTGTSIECETQQISLSALTGTNTITIPTGSSFNDCEYITIVFGGFCGTDPNHPVITGETNSLIYKLTGVTGNTLYLDRLTPNFSGCSGPAQVVCNSCENEYPVSVEFNPNCKASEIDPSQQLNAWTMNVVWDKKPIGFDVNGIDENLTGFTSNKHVSTKQYLGYTTSSGQTFTNVTGGTISYPTSYYNTYNEQIEVIPEEQRCIAVIHYSELGDLKNDPERFFKYDDYISTNNTEADALLEDSIGNPITDLEYFEVYIPFIQYHKNTGTTIGALFTMDTTDYYVSSSKNAYQKIKFRYLLDEFGGKVGKVFVNNKVVVFDDQELVATLDYKSNRKYTLPAPKINLLPSDLPAAQSFYSGSTEQTIWLTYMFNYTGDTQLNGLPCNYYTKFVTTTDSTYYNIPCQLYVKFNDGYFSKMFTGSTCDFANGFIANQFQLLIQVTDNGDLPSPSQWKLLDMTSYIPSHTVGNLINPSNLVNYSFQITYDMFEDDTSIFDLETYIGEIPNEPSTDPQFGDEQPFPGSVRLVRATDIEKMNFLVNLPASQFNVSQNPTYTNGQDKRVTEIALLNENKEVLVIGKTANPVKRSGTQVFAMKIDF
jgi:hypothetical protein